MTDLLVAPLVFIPLQKGVIVKGRVTFNISFGRSHDLAISKVLGSSAYKSPQKKNDRNSVTLLVLAVPRKGFVKILRDTWLN